MQQERLEITYSRFDDFEELNEEDRELVLQARKALSLSYSPYSRFKVGAAVRTKEGKIVLGANQENAAYPSGLCAERTALFSCAAQGLTPQMLAIVAQDEKGNVASPYPCGACRQVMSETEHRYEGNLTVIVGQKDGGFVKFDNTSSLLPFEFEL